MCNYVFTVPTFGQMSNIRVAAREIVSWLTLKEIFNMCSKQDFIPTTLLVIVEPILNVVSRFYSNFFIYMETVRYGSDIPMIVHV